MSEAQPEFTAAEIASAQRYLDSEGYDGAVTDPIEYLRAQRAADDLHAHDFPVSTMHVTPFTKAEALEDGFTAGWNAGYNAGACDADVGPDTAPSYDDALAEFLSTYNTVKINPET